MKSTKLVASLILTLALAVLLIQNRAPVQAHFLMVTVEMPLILLLFLAVAGGFGLGLFVALLGKPKPKA